MVRSYANTELVPNAGKWDQQHVFPKDQVKAIGEMGYVHPPTHLILPSRPQTTGFMSVLEKSTHPPTHPPTHPYL